MKDLFADVAPFVDTHVPALCYAWNRDGSLRGGVHQEKVRPGQGDWVRLDRDDQIWVVDESKQQQQCPDGGCRMEQCCMPRICPRAATKWFVRDAGR